MRHVFEFLNYREYLTEWIQGQGAGSYGLKGRIAARLGISSSFLSQVLKGEKTLTPDQAHELSELLGLNELESDFLHLLVEMDRASNHRYREKLNRKLNALKKKSQEVGQRVPRTHELTDEQKAVYYSSWMYAGIRNLSAVPGMGNIRSLAEHLQLEPTIVQRVVKFLLENQLCIEKDGVISYGPASLHVDRTSPFVNKHHQNWRFQAIQHMENRNEKDLFFTGAMSLSAEAFEEIRRRLPNFIQEVMKVTGPSDSEIVACLNIDWFEF